MNRSRTHSLAVLMILAPIVEVRAKTPQYGNEYYMFEQASRQGDPGAASSGGSGLAIGADPSRVSLVSLVVPGGENGSMAIGDLFRIEATVSLSGYLQVVDFGSSGTITELYPRQDVPRPVSPNQPVVLDGTEKQRWRVGGPVGKEFVLAFATSRPIKVPSAFLGQGPKESLVGRMQDFKEEVKQICMEDGIDVAFSHVELAILGPNGSSPPVLKSHGGLTYPAGKIHALLVGVNEYRDGGKGNFENLTCPVRDATEFRKHLIEDMKVPENQTRLLTNAEASLAGIREGLEWLGKAGRDEYAYFYFSGHGTFDPQASAKTGHRAIVPHDFDYKDVMKGGTGNLLYDTEIGEWIEASGTKGSVMIFDSCYSGAITRSGGLGSTLRPKGFFIMPEEGSKVVVDLSGQPVVLNTKRTGTFIIMASQFDQLSYEDEAVGHSLMTLGLLRHFREGLSGRELFQSVQDFVRDRAREGGEVQVPVLVDNTGESQFVPFLAQ